MLSLFIAFIIKWDRRGFGTHIRVVSRNLPVRKSPVVVRLLRKIVLKKINKLVGKIINKLTAFFQLASLKIGSQGALTDEK